MKALFSLILLVFTLNKNICCVGSGVNVLSNDRITPEAAIQELTELIRYFIKNGDSANGVPVLDPYLFEWGQLNFTSEIFNVNVNITNGNWSGLGNLKLQQFDFSKSELAIELNVNIPSLEFSSEYYELNGSLYDAMPIKGQGVIYIEVQNITLWGKIYLKQSPDSKAVLLDKLENMEFSIDRIVSRTQFDNNIDAIISAMVEELLADYLTRFSRFIAATYSDALIQYLNKTLDKFDSWELIDVILSYLNE